MNCPKCKREVEMLKFTTTGVMCRDCHNAEREGTPPVVSSEIVVPRRRFGITLEGGGDSIEEIAELLYHMADEMGMNRGISSSTVGGCSYGGHYDIGDRGDKITPETFRADLKAWMENKRHNVQALPQPVERDVERK